jgi:hypothetical protein
VSVAEVRKRIFVCRRGYSWGCAVAQLVEALRYKPEGRGFDSRWYDWIFSFRPHYGPGVDSASNRKWYQVCFLGVKAAGAYGRQPYHLHVPTVLESGSLNLLEPSGPVQACNGIALHFLEGIVASLWDGQLGDRASTPDRAKIFFLLNKILSGSCLDYKDRL